MATSSTPSVFITGAAAGIGRAATHLFAREGYRVGAYDVDEVGLAGLASELDVYDLTTGRLDVRDVEAWKSTLADFTAPSGGRLTVLVNNAGLLQGGRFEEIPYDDYRRTVDVNVLGVINGCYAAYPYLRDTPGAHVVNMASASAIYGQPELAVYSATKFAVRGLSEALDLEWKRDDITVTALWPLFVNTGMTHGLDIGTTRSLGVHLAPEDVAKEIFSAATSNHGLLGGVHRPVGRQAKLAFAAAEMAPTWANRLVNKLLTK